MSDILIKGMEMPTDRSRWVVIYPDGKVEFSDKTDEWETLDKGVVPVLPHGRLIEEADAIKTVWMILNGLGYLKEENPQLEQTVREVFATAPTIEVE